MNNNNWCCRVLIGLGSPSPDFELKGSPVSLEVSIMIRQRPLIDKALCSMFNLKASTEFLSFLVWGYHCAIHHTHGASSADLYKFNDQYGHSLQKEEKKKYIKL
ncbi:uncharacterized protein LOC112128011 [Cimex lectularius]|uniref:Uncharacterized protein n=1 Tax=Cimex lectularius TaxID=79782 RepID=A0A8I6ST16_CIMLE|nr:uncharacterized protein LOC112128011 [Cimex lectularius]